MGFLAYDSLFVGRRLKPSVYRVTAEEVERYVRAVGEDWDYYRENGLVPPVMAAVYTREANLTEGRMPPGSIHVSQDFEFIHPVRIGDVLVTQATIVEKYLNKDRKYAVIEAETRNEKGELVGKSIMTGIWGE